ncbi:Hint domain-containing protein [Pseudaestuariivita rosea]|uniref:Hint domain-containing protein n=1 Tax=Pseudaestuariivita rosea TaxID=2763263 RepID=UPI001ABACC34|nr:Hint domain-containing protein [Pseudaestuariivita rosea]
MAVYTIAIFSAQNLLNGSGQQAFGPSDTNASTGPGGTFTHGNEAAQFIEINDTDDGSQGTDDVLDDGTSAAQELAEPVTLTYLQGGSVITTTFPVGTQIQAELIEEYSNGFQIMALRFEDPNNPGGLVTAGYSFIDPTASPGDPAVSPPGGTVLGTYVGGNNSGSTPSDQIACFAAGTMIELAEGCRPVQALAPGDLIMTRDNGLVEIAVVEKTRVPCEWIKSRDNLRPVVLAAGLVGNTAPLCISPQHRVLVRGAFVELMTGEPEVFVPAIAFVDAGLAHRHVPDSGITYYHVECATHQVIRSDGAWTETRLPGEPLFHSPDNRTTSVTARLALRRRDAVAVLYSQFATELRAA